MNAADAISKLETLPLGQPWADAAAVGRSAIDAEYAAARAKVFSSDLVPKSADAIAQFAELLKRPPAGQLAAAFSAYHARSLDRWPELAELFRSPEALEEVAGAAMVAAPVDDRSIAEAAAVRRYQLQIAQQLADAPSHELGDAARRLLACAELERRFEVAKARHEAHAAAELARIEAERRQAARVVLDRTVERVREAEARARDAQQQAMLSAREYRQLRAEALVERLLASGLRELRFRVGDGDEIYEVGDLLSTARGMSIEQLARYEAALAAHEVV